MAARHGGVPLRSPCSPLPRLWRTPRPGGNDASTPLTSALPCPPSPLWQRCCTARAPCSKPVVAVSPRTMSTPSGPRSSLLPCETIRSTTPPPPPLAPLFPHLLPHSLSSISSAEPKQRPSCRRASPAIENSPSKPQTTSSSAVPYSPSLREESKNGARNRRHQAFPFLLRPRTCEQARGGHRPTFLAIVVPMCSPCRSLSHGQQRFLSRSPEPSMPSPPCSCRVSPPRRVEEEGEAPYPFARARGPQDGPLPALHSPDPADPVR